MPETQRLRAGENTRMRDYISYVYNIVDLITEYNPSLTEHEIMSFHNIDSVSEEHYVMPYMNVDIMAFDNNTTNRIDRAHFHIPYFLKPQYLQKYIEAAIVYTYFIDREIGISRVNARDCYIRSNMVETAQGLNMSIFNVSGASDDNTALGDLILSLIAYDIDWGASSFESINPSTKICVYVDDFRINSAINSLSDLSRNLNFWYDLGSDLNRVSFVAGVPDTDNVVPDIDNNEVRDESRYFDDVPPYQHHTTSGGSFALYPELYQSSGTRNYSRIGDAELDISFPDDYDEIYDTPPSVIEPENCRTDECPVCYDNIQIGDYYKCTHGICDTCYSGWRGQGKITCPVCRASQRTVTIVPDYENTLPMLPSENIES